MKAQIVNRVVKVVVKNELYVYMGGSLLYKRWLDKDYGKVMYNHLGE